MNIHGKNDVEKDLKPGEFNVLPITPEYKGEMGMREKRSITFDVIYYPSYEGGYEECLEKASVLPEIIGTVTTPEGDKVHGTGFEFNFEDDAMHCIVSYPHFVYTKAAENNTMETLEISQEA